MGENRHTDLAKDSGRRAFLRLTASGLIVPLGAMAPVSWRQGPSSAPDALSRPPICRAAAGVTAIAPGATSYGRNWVMAD